MKIGIIGSGFGLYGLLPAFHSIPGCQVVAICGEKTQRLLDYCKSIGLDAIYTDWEKMLESEKLDAIAIAVIPSAQYMIAKAAMEKGIHVFAEKPLAANLKDAKKLLSLAKKRRVVTAVDFLFPEINAWQKTKELLDKKTYGALQYVSVAWDFFSYDIKNKIKGWKTDAKEGGGALSFYASHVLYYLERYAGKITKIKSKLSYAKGSGNGADVAVDALLTFQNNVTGHMHVRCNTSGLYDHKLMCICEKATIVLENRKDVTDSFTLTVYPKEGNVKEIKTKKPHRVTGEDQRVKIVKKLATRFVTSCHSHTPMTPSFAEGVRVQELIEMIRKEQN